MSDLISVIVTTYNWPDALDSALRGLSRQTDSGFEVVIADDESGPATTEIIERWKSSGGMPVKYVWHESWLPRRGNPQPCHRGLTRELLHIFGR